MSDKIINGVHDYSDEKEYVYPANPKVREHLEWFRGLKLGLMMHWMPSCQFSSYESWPLSEDSTAWSREDIDWTDNMDEAMRQYRDCNKTFNPFKFRPDKWAKLAKDCGFKYLLFTTKHHDGFCMFDSQYSDYKITAPDCPFHTSPNADIVRSMFDAFRKEGLAISAYFSKPDWHSPYYWSPDFPKPMTRNVNYRIEEYPELWEKFTEYTHNQLTEICTNYGKVDVLWLDGGQVRPGNNGQDIRLGEVVDKIRAGAQPHLIVCDRTVGGPYENIITPEGGVPSAAIHVPWEACIPIGGHFAFHYDDRSKSPLTLVHMFLDIISKGGSLALNVTPRPDGMLPLDQVHAIRCMGRFLNTNAEGIYETHIAPCRPGREYLYTAKGDVIYLFFLYKERPYLPPRLYPDVRVQVKKVTVLRTGQPIPVCREGGTLLLDTSQVDMTGAEYAECFRIEC